MRKLATIIIASILLLCSVALAEEWNCPTCGNEATGNFCNLCGTVNPSDEWICPQCKAETKGNFCNNCGSPRPKGTGAEGTTDAVSALVTSAPTNNPNYITERTIVKNYVGRSLSLCGYSSWGGERRDQYASMTTELIMLSPDGTYISPSDDDALELYKVIAQFPESGTEFTITKDLDGKNENIGFGEIILVVSKNGESIEIPEIKNVRPSPDKTLQYVRDYRGRTLADAGYTTWSGKRMDQYGPECYVQLIISDEQGNRLNPSDYENFKYYVVKDQDIEPDTEIICYYNKDSSGKETMSGQTVDLIQITVEYSEAGVAAMEAQAAEREALEAEEAKLKESGNLLELYKDTYEVGKDLVAGNYEFLPLEDTVDIYVYLDKTALDNGDGDYGYISGKNDREYHYLTDGMYLKVTDGAAKAKRTEFSTEGDEFILYSGVYHVGVDIEPGSYEMTQYSDTCDVYIYDDEASYQNRDGDFDYLSGKGDTEYYNLREGMVVRIADGSAAKVTKK